MTSFIEKYKEANQLVEAADDSLRASEPEQAVLYLATATKLYKEIVEDTTLLKVIRDTVKNKHDREKARLESLRKLLQSRVRREIKSRLSNKPKNTVSRKNAAK
jgi:hypothetical protein